MRSGFAGERKILSVGFGETSSALDARSKLMRKDTCVVGSLCAGLSLRLALFNPHMHPFCRRGTEAKSGFCCPSKAVEEAGPAVRASDSVSCWVGGF